MDLLRLCVPILWALVAAGLGWFLYRHSVARLETKWISITGSAAIAAVAFYGMYRATPTELLRRTRGDQKLVARADLDELSRVSAHAAEEAANALRDCIELPHSKACQERLAELHAVTHQLSNGLDYLRADKP